MFFPTFSRTSARLGLTLCRAHRATLVLSDFGEAEIAPSAPERLVPPRLLENLRHGGDGSYVIIGKP